MTMLYAPRILAVLLLSVMLHACGGDASAPSVVEPVDRSGEARKFVDEVLGTMRASINRDRIDWAAFDDSVRHAARNARAIHETYPAVGVAIRLLGDGHSSFTTPMGEVFFHRVRECTFTGTAAVPQAPDIGYVRVTGVSGSGSVTLAFADQLHAAIREQDRPGLAGWIVDLRGNGGGNMWPMLAGMAPLLGNGTVGHFVEPNGRVSTWEIRGGESYLDGQRLQPVTTPYTLRHAPLRVAVLLDQRVASSGEATAIAFHGRPDTRSFGIPTCGLSTSNVMFRLSDGSILNLTVARMADRNLVEFGGQVHPDEVIADHAAAVARALQWIRTAS
jgi:carboxyl-terminal processing protease